VKSAKSSNTQPQIVRHLAKRELCYTLSLVRLSVVCL